MTGVKRGVWVSMQEFVRDCDRIKSGPEVLYNKKLSIKVNSVHQESTCLFIHLCRYKISVSLWVNRSRSKEVMSELALRFSTNEFRSNYKLLTRHTQHYSAQSPFLIRH